ncbi:MAG: SRPBCC domain-containing protein [Pseudomonadota bacterium]
MEATGEKAIDAPRERVYNALHDVVVLKRILPGVQTASRDGADSIRLDTQSDLGNGPTHFVVQLEFYNEDPPAGYSVRGRIDGGDAGMLRGNAHIALASISETTTNLAYHVSGEATGPLADLRADEMERRMRVLLDAFIMNLAAYVEGDGPVRDLAVMADEVAASPLPPPVKQSGPTPLVTTHRGLEPTGAALAGSSMGDTPRGPTKVGYRAADGNGNISDHEPTPDGYAAGPGYQPSAVFDSGPDQPRVDMVSPADEAGQPYRARGRARPPLRNNDPDPGISRWLLTALGVGIIVVLLSEMF